MVLQHNSVGNYYVGIKLNIILCQCRDFPQSYVLIPLAIATSYLFHNFSSLGSLLHFEINIFFKNTG